MGVISNYRGKKEVKRKAVKEAEKIFMKLNRKMALADGTFPKVSESTPRAYNKEAFRIERQVVNTRVKQYEDNIKLKKSS